MTSINFFTRLERAAEAFNYSDVDTAQIELEKGLQSVTARERPERSPRPQSTHTWAEVRKAVDALGYKDYALSATCLRKALQQVEAANLDHSQALIEGESLAAALEREDFTSVAFHLRQVAEILKPLGRLATSGAV